MDDIEKELTELDELKAKQSLHRRQLEENRKRALAKKNQTKRFVSIGKMVESILPDADNLSEDEIQKILSERLNMKKQTILCSHVIRSEQKTVKSP